MSQIVGQELYCYYFMSGINTSNLRYKDTKTTDHNVDPIPVIGLHDILTSSFWDIFDWHLNFSI